MNDDAARSKAEGQLVVLDEARARLAKVATVDEAKNIRDKAESLRHYAKQQGLGLEAQNKAAEIKIRAERRAGEILSEIERTPPEKRHISPQAGGKSEPRQTYAETIKNAGIAPETGRRWQAEASVPEPIFESFVAAARESTAELTSAAVVTLAKSISDKPTKEREEAVRSEPGVVWARHMRLMSQVVASLRAVAARISDSKRASLKQAVGRCIEELTKLQKEIE